MEKCFTGLLNSSLKYFVKYRDMRISDSKSNWWTPEEWQLNLYSGLHLQLGIPRLSMISQGWEWLGVKELMYYIILPVGIVCELRVRPTEGSFVGLEKRQPIPVSGMSHSQRPRDGNQLHKQEVLLVQCSRVVLQLGQRRPPGNKGTFFLYRFRGTNYISKFTV